MQVSDGWIEDTIRMLKRNPLASPDVRGVIPALEELLKRRKADCEMQEEMDRLEPDLWV